MFSRLHEPPSFMNKYVHAIDTSRMTKIAAHGRGEVGITVTVPSRTDSSASISSCTTVIIDIAHFKTCHSRFIYGLWCIWPFKWTRSPSTFLTLLILWYCKIGVAGVKNAWCCLFGFRLSFYGVFSLQFGVSIHRGRVSSLRVSSFLLWFLSFIFVIVALSSQRPSFGFVSFFLLNFNRTT